MAVSTKTIAIGNQLIERLEMCMVCGWLDVYIVLWVEEGDAPLLLIWAPSFCFFGWIHINIDIVGQTKVRYRSATGYAALVFSDYRAISHSMKP